MPGTYLLHPLFLYTLIIVETFHMVSVRFIERSIIMKISEIEVCAVKPVAPPKLDVALPVSERENFLKALNHE